MHAPFCSLAVTHAVSSAGKLDHGIVHEESLRRNKTRASESTITWPSSWICHKLWNLETIAIKSLDIVTPLRLHLSLAGASFIVWPHAERNSRPFPRLNERTMAWNGANLGSASRPAFFSVLMYTVVSPPVGTAALLPAFVVVIAETA